MTNNTPPPAPQREAERRFLLHQCPAITFDRILQMRQFYILRDATRSYTARFRLITDLSTCETSCIETHKIGTGFDIMETEYPVDPRLYTDLQRLYGIGHEITKHRHEVTIDTDTWEIDVYDGDFAGLVVAELEMDDPHAPFTVPASFGPTEEVTFWRGMKNFTLSLDGLSNELKSRLHTWYGHTVWKPR